MMGKKYVVETDDWSFSDFLKTGCGLVVFVVLGACGWVGYITWFSITRQPGGVGSEEVRPSDRLAQEKNAKVTPISKGDPIRKGTLILTTRQAILKDVVAWVEVDGEKMADWKVGTTDVRLNLAAGDHRIAVYSIYRGRRQPTVYDKQITITPDATTEVAVLP